MTRVATPAGPEHVATGCVGIPERHGRAGVLKSMKTSLLETAGPRLFRRVGRSRWRSRRLLVLCYHGVAMRDEAGSHPEMFIPRATFERRMALLHRCGATVLPLGEAIARVRRGDLPPRAVAITFDDGWADFAALAYPVLRRYAFPATVYLTTYYCVFNRPVFRLALAYMLWRRRDRVVDDHGLAWLPPRVDLRTAARRDDVVVAADAYVKARRFTGQQKDDLLQRLASKIGFEYAELGRERLFHLMTPAEVTAIARDGVDVQLHTHRHRTPLTRERFVGEIVENRECVRALTGREDLVHFCYPSGATRPDFLPWLAEAGVQSATTCRHGFAAGDANPLLLPRLLDHVGLADTEFEAWVSGVAAFIPKRRPVVQDVAPE